MQRRSFLAMTGLWCALGYALVCNPLAGARASRIGHAVLPFVLLGLGVAILRDARELLG